MRRWAVVLANRVLNAAVARLKPQDLPRGRRAADGHRRHDRDPADNPLLYLREPGRWVVVASNSGVAWEPGWWLNLQAGAPATVEVGGACTAITGHEVTAEERERLWQEGNEQVFDYAHYLAKVDRRLAVVALTPVIGSGQAADRAEPSASRPHPP